MSLARALDLAPGRVIAGKYTLARPLGVGGMGAVWSACNEATGAEVAVKVLLPRPDDGAEVLARFRREAYATAQLSHRGIVRIYDLVEHEGDSLALVMERLRGKSLATLLAQSGSVAIEDAVTLALDVLSALAHAHGAGIVHRDLKPENIFLAVDPDGVVTPKILDFGISKLRFPEVSQITRQGEMLGTPSYMSPEQVRGGEIDARSDLFNVGILLYEMISGQNPFAMSGMHSVVVAVLEDEPPPLLNVPPRLAAVIERALSKDPADRYPSATLLAEALRAAMGLPARPSWSGLHEIIESTPPPPPANPSAALPAQDRNPVRIGVATAFAIAGLVLLALGPARLDARAQHRTTTVVAKRVHLTKAIAIKEEGKPAAEAFVVSVWQRPPSEPERAAPPRRVTILSRRESIARNPGF
jgi:serine/threonine-protein kinase